jgi:DNA-binding PadR family transcriptional regulator
MVFKGREVNRVDQIRLLQLAELAKRGPSGGHDLVSAGRELQMQVGMDVSSAAAHRVLRRMADEGLVEKACRPPQYPVLAREGYAITDEGRQELNKLREEMLRTVHVTPDPLDVALSVAGDLPDDVLGEIIDGRLRELRLRIDALKRQVQAARSPTPTRDHYLLLHQLDRLRSELAWHRNIRTVLAYRAGEHRYPVRAPH